MHQSLLQIAGHNGSAYARVSEVVVVVVLSRPISGDKSGSGRECVCDGLQHVPDVENQLHRCVSASFGRERNGISRSRREVKLTQ